MSFAHIWRPGQVVSAETETLKAALMFWETETLKKIPFILGNGSPEKTHIFKEVIFRARKMKQPNLKKLLTFQEIGLSSLWLIKTFYNSGGSFKAWESNKELFFSTIP